MKTTLLATTAAAAFVCSYFFNLAMENSEQYLAVVAVKQLWVEAVAVGGGGGH